MKYYQAKSFVINGNNYRAVYKKAWQIFLEIKRKSKRRPYIRSVYFDKEKIFFDYFWEHLKQKNKTDRLRRVSIFSCAIELIVNTRLKPETIVSPQNNKNILHKFAGISKDKQKFFVHIKENKKTGSKYFMSCFPGV
jgi:hypothetical protein